jgi:hypothetical protein
MKKRRKSQEEEVSGMWVLDFWVTRTFWIFGGWWFAESSSTAEAGFQFEVHEVHKLAL